MFWPSRGVCVCGCVCAYSLMDMAAVENLRIEMLDTAR
jgi:hypothetical protein